MSDKSIDDLLKMVEGAKTPSTDKRPTGNNKNVLKFIEEMGVESGTVLIPSFLIFYYYRMIWKSSEEDRRYKASKHSFFQTFHSHFVQQRKTKQRYYLIKENVFETNEELLKKANEYDRSHWAKRKKKVQEEV